MSLLLSLIIGCAWDLAPEVDPFTLYATLKKNEPAKCQDRKTEGPAIGSNGYPRFARGTYQCQDLNVRFSLPTSTHVDWLQKFNIEANSARQPEHLHKATFNTIYKLEYTFAEGVMTQLRFATLSHQDSLSRPPRVGDHFALISQERLDWRYDETYDSFSLGQPSQNTAGSARALLAGLAQFVSQQDTYFLFQSTK